MSSRRLIQRFIVVLILCPAVGSAAFIKVEDFESMSPGAISGQGSWTATNSNAVVTTEPGNPANQVANFGAGTDYSAYRAFPGIADGTTGTLFFRLMQAGTQHNGFGLSDVAAPGAWGDFETTVRLRTDSPPVTPMTLRDGSSYPQVRSDVEDDAWLNVWMVTNNATDRYEVYVQGGADFPTQTQLYYGSQFEYAFRNGTASSLATLYFRSGNAPDHEGPYYVDDIWLDAAGSNLALPPLDTPTPPPPPVLTGTIYREIFPNDSGGNLSIAGAGWQAHDANGAPVTDNIGVSFSNGRPADLPSINANDPSGILDPGYFSNWGGSTTARLYWTDELTIVRPDNLLDEARWYQGNASANVAFRVALCLDGTWIASNQTFSNPGVSSGGNFDTEAIESILDFDGSLWLPLDFQEGSLLSLDTGATPFALPATGDVTAFGLFSDARSATLRFDSFELRTIDNRAVIPEPATLALLAAGLAAMARRRRR